MEPLEGKEGGQLQRNLRIFALVTVILGCDESSPMDGPRFGEPRELAVELEIGGLEGPDEETFGSISGLAVDSEGRIYVSDRQANAVRVFQPDGSFAYSIGRTGEGPGELSGPCCLAIGPRGYLWVRESGNARYSWFEPGTDGATYVGGLMLAHGDANRPAPIHFVGDSLFLDVGFGGRTPAGAPVLERHWRTFSGRTLRVGELPAADLADLGTVTISSSADGREETRFFYPVHGPNDLLDFGPEGRVVQGLTDSYQLTLWTPGDTVVVRGDRTEGPVLTAREDSLQSARIISMEQWAGRSLSLPRAARKQPLVNASFDSEGRLWVEVSTEDGAPRVFEVWSADGTPLDVVSLPRDVRVNPPFGWIGRDHLVGIRRDALGVEYVVRVTHGVSF